MNCKNGKHNLWEIFRARESGDVDNVVRWCSECGAVVVDQDMDNRVMAGRMMKMQFPKALEQRDQLVMALEDCLDDSIESLNTSLCKKLDVYRPSLVDRQRKIIAAAEAALAAAKGE